MLNWRLNVLLLRSLNIIKSYNLQFCPSRFPQETTATALYKFISGVFKGGGHKDLHVFIRLIMTSEFSSINIPRYFFFQTGKKLREMSRTHENTVVSVGKCPDRPPLCIHQHVQASCLSHTAAGHHQHASNTIHFCPLKL